MQCLLLGRTFNKFQCMFLEHKLLPGPLVTFREFGRFFGVVMVSNEIDNIFLSTYMKNLQKSRGPQGNS